MAGILATLQEAARKRGNVEISASDLRLVLRALDTCRKQLKRLEQRLAKTDR